MIQSTLVPTDGNFGSDRRKLGDKKRSQDPKLSNLRTVQVGGEIIVAEDF